MPNLTHRLSLFVSEFKRRKVSRLISVYAVVGCGIIGTVDIIGGRFLFPDWLIRSIIGMVIGGFPIALILEWIYEKTPAGFIRTKRLTADEKAAVPQAKFRLNWVSIIVLSITLFFSFAFFTIPRPNMIGFEGKDWILITDLENNTNDSIFDLSLKQALEITIDQSKHVSVYNKRQVENVLKRMQLPVDSKINTKLGLEIAERENIKAVLSLSISSLGSSYILSTKIFNPYSGESISRQTTAESKDDILEALNKLAKQLRKDLGESILSIRSNKVPLQKATTHSLDALRYQALGSHAWANIRTAEAELLLLKAIDLDPEFALAHEQLGSLYYWDNNREKGDYHYDIALNQLDRLTEKEILFIQAKAEEIRGNRLEAITKWKNYLDRYPNSSETWFRIGYNYFRLSHYEEAIDAFNESLKFSSTEDPSTLINIASCYSQLKMFKESIRNYRKAFEIKPDWMVSGNLNHEFGFTYVRSGDIEKGAQVFEKMIAGNQEQQARGYRSMALLKMSRGEYNNAIELLKMSSGIYETLGYGLSQFRNCIFLALIYKEKGMLDELDAELDIANSLLLSTSSGPGWFTYLGVLYVRNGQLAKAEKLMAELSERVKESRRDDESSYFQLKGEIELAKGNHTEALEHLQKAMLLNTSSYTLESLANYYLSIDDIDNAICTYEDIINNKYTLGWEGQRPSIFAYYALGKLYDEEGNREQALTYYQGFLNILDNADEDLQVFIDAKSRLKELL